MARKTTALHAVLAALLMSALPPAAADIDYDARCEMDTYRSICLTSFVWCDHNLDTPCSFPDNFYPEQIRGNSIMAALLWEQDYNLTWAKTDPDYPVFVEWQVGAWEDDVKSLFWGKNLTDGETSFAFKFSDLAEEFEDDIDPQRVRGQASQIFNSITISQPERPLDESEAPFVDRTTQFAVYDNEFRAFLEVQRQMGNDDMYDTWKLPVGIAVGLGVPVLMALSCVVGVLFGKRRERRAAGRPTKKETIGE